ncbi:MAG: HAD-IC family P-type ATPase, partial [Actinomycetota bacterium]|nr:HAD-IC family P-type ATPase [Actinomycetota bacterium]
MNHVPSAPTRTIRQIIHANMLTPVNLIMGTLLVLILVAGKPGDALFAGVIVSNSVIGILQELRAKKALDKLNVLNAPKARIVRDGTVAEHPTDHVVADDVLLLEPGDQVVVDGEVVDANGLELDESLLTGEADPVAKDAGEAVLSGSFVAAGTGHIRATRIGAEAYASSLAEEARRFVLVNSELRNGINQILRWLTWIIPPVSALLLISLLDTEDRWNEALQGTVAAAVAMVPDGLVLLTSIAFIVGVLALARRQALAKELASVELLARVDVLCLDKTGTITTGAIVFAALEELDGALTDVGQVLADMAAADPAPNATLDAVAAAFSQPPQRVAVDRIAFSSARKWARTTFDDGTTWYLGAPDVLSSDPHAAERVAAHAAMGRRVIALATGSAPDDEELPADLQPVALVLLEDQIRDDAAEILGYFDQQGITLRVISGDHPTTVAAVARRAGVPHADRYIDARELDEDPDALGVTMDETVVFGRVTPHQKRAMVQAMQARGHVVAMTGDGVNDVLALKDA